jgi:hypothetical protein
MMDVEVIKAIGEYIVMPICFFGFFAFIVWKD